MTFAKQAEAVKSQMEEGANKLGLSIQELVDQGIALEQRALTAEARADAAEARVNVAEEKLQTLYAVIDEASSSVNSTSKAEVSPEPQPEAAPEATADAKAAGKPKRSDKRPAKKSSAAKKPAIGLPLPKRKPRKSSQKGIPRRPASETNPQRTADIIAAVTKTPGKDADFYRVEIGHVKSTWWNRAVNELVSSGQIIQKGDALYLPDMAEAA